MVILLIGGECSLMNALIDKLHKDKHRVYPVSYTHLDVYKRQSQRRSRTVPEAVSI